MKVKLICKLAAILIMNSHRRSRSTAPLLLYLDSTTDVLSTSRSSRCTPEEEHRYSLYRRLCGP